MGGVAVYPTRGLERFRADASSIYDLAAERQNAWPRARPEPSIDLAM